MQTTGHSTSNPEKRASLATRTRWTAAILGSVALLALGWGARLHADSPPATPLPREHRLSVVAPPEPTFGHAAHPDRDVGAGEADCVPAQHLGTERP